jgi:hypothetical protein
MAAKSKSQATISFVRKPKIKRPGVSMLKQNIAKVKIVKTMLNHMWLKVNNYVNI